ncbi:MAG: hypothetical protein QOI95_2106 [Acidimicrobiaceae bacterium]|jgi:hypothetical protein
MMARTTHHVVRVEQRLLRECLDVIVLSCIKDVVAVSPGADQSGKAQLGEMLGNSGGLHSDVIGQGVDRMLAVKKRPHDPQPGVIGQQLENVGGGRELGVARLCYYLLGHADSVA